MAGKLICSISDSINAWIGKSILIVEDVSSNYFYIAATVNKSGVAITWVKSGEEALDYINRGIHFDLILMDVQLSGMDGYQTTRMIKAIHPEIPIIAQTAYAMLGEKEKSQKAGCDGYLSKPIKPSVLLETISKYL